MRPVGVERAAVPGPQLTPALDPETRAPMPLPPIHWPIS